MCAHVPFDSVDIKTEVGGQSSHAGAFWEEDGDEPSEGLDQSFFSA